MSTREQFGDYLLLKKLTEDPLGETFRAGKLGAKGMERVALLRVFNGQGLDGQRLWADAQERSGVQQLLRGPNLGEGIEMGEIQGIPYVAYDYISGKNLATLLQQVTKKRSSIPTEHGLLITERIALGLALAAENRQDGERIHHGFVIPHLVMISNEGESRLLGFEVGPALRAFAAHPIGRRHFGRYLAPEALAGAPLDRADDIYSLGVVLLELLTGKPLPAPAPGGYGPVIEQARLMDDGAAIPDPLQQLLRQSLVPREHRLRDVATWHKTLNKWMFEGKYNPTTFNLAFFMHNLFRQDIERESQEIEVEKTLPLPVAAATPSPQASEEPTAAPVAASEPTPVSAGAPVTMPIAIDSAQTPPPGTEAGTAAAAAGSDPESASGSSRKGLWIALAALLLLAAAGATWWWLGLPGIGSAADRQAAASPTATDRRAAAAAETDALGSVAAGAGLPDESGGDLRVDSADEATVSAEAEDQLQAQIDALVEQKASAMESQLREQMDSQLAALREQLESAQAEAEAREKELQAQKDKAAEEARQKAAEEEAAKLAEEERLRLEAEAQRQAQEEEAKIAEAEEPAEEAAPPPPPPPPARPAVRRGDLVEPGPGIGVPKLIRIPPARFPEMARRLNKSDVEVVVRVLVDENGDVLEARLPNKKVGFGFDAEALKVARKATYQPARAGNVPVKMWAVVRVKFQG